MTRATTTLGLIADLHHDPGAAGQRGWINRYDTANLPSRVADALAWFAEAGAELVVVAGDLVERPDSDAVASVCSLLTSAGLPVAMVGGNHDARDGDRMRRHAAERGVALLDTAHPGVTSPVVGIRATPLTHAEGEARFAGRLAGALDGARVVVSHFPVLSLATQLTEARLPYAGDLANRRAVHDCIAAGDRPVVVLSGHVHARTTRVCGRILQFTAGALVEPPHDAAVVTITTGDGGIAAVERATRRLGPAAAVDPVFSPDRERWEAARGGWRRHT